MTHIITPFSVDEAGEYIPNVLMAFVRSPMTFPGHEIYVVEIGLVDPIDGIEPMSVEDGKHVYMFASMTHPPVYNERGEPVRLTAEIGPGSVVKLALKRSGAAYVLNAVSLVEHVIHNPFAMVA